MGLGADLDPFNELPRPDLEHVNSGALGVGLPEKGTSLSPGSPQKNDKNACRYDSHESALPLVASPRRPTDMALSCGAQAADAR